MFTPPRCPHPTCLAHNIEHLDDAAFFIRKGSYKPKCRAQSVPRFGCRFCRRTFSRQTFRHDYRDHKPHLNASLFSLLASGLGLRQSGRLLRLSRRCTELKARKISAHLARLCRNLLDQFPAGSWFQMDEMETYENERRVSPLTLPVLIEKQSMLIVAAQSASIRPSGKMSERRRAAIERRAKREGRRQDRSRSCLKRVLRQAAKYCKKLGSVFLDTDEKTLYPPLARRAFGDKLQHARYSSKLVRDTSNPLFPINLTNAMARDLTGRLRRRSWLASKQREFLDLQLNVFMAYRNYVRPRFNQEHRTPAQLLGFVPKRLKPAQLLGWRQDWGWYSTHPLSGQTSIRDYRRWERGMGRASYRKHLAA